MGIQTDQGHGSRAVSSSSAVFRKTEFHPARKPFNGFSNRGGSDFKMETLNPSSSSNNNNNNRAAFSSSSVKKVDGPDSLEFDRELTFTKTIRKIGAGLENLGNTCYLNSVLQCLTYTEPLAAYLQDVAHEQRCRVAGFCALCAMQRHVRNALQATGKILAPKYLVSNLRSVSQNFRKCRQEDAHEYMINLLECMHKCCLPSGVPSESSDAYRSSLVHRIFGGSLRSRVKCAQCSHCSDKFDPFLDLSLDISKADSLQRALLRFTAVELLDNGAKVYQCERCKEKVKAGRQLTVFKAPSVLTLHFKRFEAYRSGKIDKKVEFPPAINMKPFVTGPYEGNLKYTLYGVLVHHGGSIHSGHYYCYVRTSSGMWYSLDDKKVFQVSEKTVFNQKAYMLFYVRDRQNTAPKNPVTVAKKETSKESVAMNRASLNISSNRNDQENGATVIKACSLNAPVANGTAALRACDKGASACLTQKDVNGKETQKDPPSSVEAKEILNEQNGAAPVKASDQGAPAVLIQKDKENQKDSLSSVEAKEILKMENSAAPAGSCDQGAPAVLTHKDSNALVANVKLPSEACDQGAAPAFMTQKDSNALEIQTDTPSSVEAEENLERPCDVVAPAVLAPKELNNNKKEESLPQANGEGSLVKEDSKAACTILPGEATCLLDDSANTQVLATLPTSVANAANSVDEKNSANDLNESDTSMKVNNVSIGDSPMEESVLDNQTLAQQAEESIKPTSAEETLTAPRKTRKRNMKTVQVGLSSFKLALGVRKKKKQKKGRSSTLAVKKGTSKERSTPQITSKATSGSACLHGKGKSVGVDNERLRASNGNTLLASPTVELKERTYQNGAVLASDQQQPLRSSDLSEASQNNAKRKRDSSKEEQILLQKQQVMILTRGLPETVVAKWDDEVSASKKTRKSESTRIGYVADEWHEEYDRGKKKKKRIKEEMYAGPNPFQSFASKKQQTDTKKKWTQRMNTAKTGFRI